MMIKGKRARRALWGLAAAGMTVLGCPALAMGAVQSVGSDVPEAVSAGTTRLDPCSNVAQDLWNAANELVGLVPGGNVIKAISVLSKVARFSTCQTAGNQTAFSLSELTDMMAPIAEDAADAQARHEEEKAVTALIDRLNDERDNIKFFHDIYQLPEKQQKKKMKGHKQELNLLINRIDVIATDADSIEAESTAMQFWVAPTFRMAAMVKNLAYNIEYDLVPPKDIDRKNELLTKKIPDARNDSIVRLLEIESGLENYIQNSKLDRGYTSNSSGTMFHYRIHAEVTRNGRVEYLRDWSCSRTVFQPKACSERDSRKSEFFSKARDTALQIRESVAKAFDANYLSFKNQLGVYNFLPDETPSGFYIKNDLSNNCMAVDQAGYVSMTNAFDVCGSGLPSAPQASTWQMVPATGQIQSKALKGMCLDLPAGQAPGDNPRVMVRECEDTVPADPADPDGPRALPSGSKQGWGFHPLGLIVNLATGQCLTSPTIAYNGAPLVVTGCNYLLPPPDDFSPKHGEYIPGYGVQHGDVNFSGQYWFVDDSPWWKLPGAPTVESSILNGDFGTSWSDTGAP